VDETKPNYLNGVVQIQTTLKPKELLEEIRRIETEHGRVRLERWGSRTLDIDIITYGDVLKAGKELTIPHPRAFERAFVLVPWAMLEPDAVLPGHGSVKELAAPMQKEVWQVK
jgi:2-amino-4-hydroxy-6-hydroxymethyldihydropteridine diphosphokinase